jgi:hypothetical protein
MYVRCGSDLGHKYMALTCCYLFALSAGKQMPQVTAMGVQVPLGQVLTYMR